MNNLKSIVLLLLASTAINAQQVAITNNNFIRIGTAVLFSYQETGFMVSNALQCKVYKNIYVTPQIFYGERYYKLDNKDGKTSIKGAAIKFDYALINSENWKVDFGVGYAIRNIEETWAAYSFYTTDIMGLPLETPYRKRIYNGGCPVMSLNIERNISARIGVGLQTEW